MDKLINCLICKSELCYHVENEYGWNELCMGCGFCTNNKQNISLKSFNLNDFEANIPELYKALRNVDIKGYVWYPSTINKESKGVVFVDGVSLKDWGWSSIRVVFDEKENKFRSDPKTKRDFGRDGFASALVSIDYFN